MLLYSREDDRVMTKTKSLKLKEDFKKIDKFIFGISIILFLFGLLMIFSASNVTLSMGGKSPFTYIIKQAITLIISFFVFIFIIKVPSKNHYFLSVFIGGLLFFSLIYLLIFGDSTRGAKSWIDLGFYSLQPSEFIKIAIIMFFASYYEKYRERCSSSWLITLIPVVVSIIVFALVFLQPDLGTAIIISLIVALIFISLPINFKKKLIIGGIGIGVVSLGAVLLFGFDLKSKVLSQTQLDRLNFKDPCSRYTESTGYQLCNGFIAMNNGGLLGSGLGNSTQKYLYLPEPHNDFIMVIIVEEFGMVAFVAIMALYFILLCRILVIAKGASNLRGSVVAYGVFVYLFSHIVVNLGGVFGVIPMTGVPLPFLSYGGSSALTLVCALALVQRVKIETYDYKRKLIKEGNRI